MDAILALIPTFFLLSILIWLVVGIKWIKFKGFFHNSYSFIDLSFIMAYFLEQIALTLILELTKYNPTVVVGIFSIVVITTASLQNKSWESRTNLINERVIEQNNLIYDIAGENKEVITQNKHLSEKLIESRKFLDRLFNELILSIEEINKLKKKR